MHCKNFSLFHTGLLRQIFGNYFHCTDFQFFLDMSNILQEKGILSSFFYFDHIKHNFDSNLQKNSFDCRKHYSIDADWLTANGWTTDEIAGPALFASQCILCIKVHFLHDDAKFSYFFVRQTITDSIRGLSDRQGIFLSL